MVTVLTTWSVTHGATFTVTHTEDAGAGSLREAIRDANAHAGPDLIAFNIPGPPPHTIAPLGLLPAITDALTLDGTTAPDFAGMPVIDLDGNAAGSGRDGLNLTAGHCTVRGLVIRRFRRDGISISSGGSNVVEGCIIGLDATGSSDQGNTRHGVYINGSVGNLIGGTSAAARNIISGNNDNGIEIAGAAATANRVVGNWIGTDVSGRIDLGNTGSGVTISSAPGNCIGGPSAAERNVISGNNADGLTLSGAGATNNVVEGNFIGTDATGLNALKNGSHGVRTISSARGNRIGGPASGAGNRIAFNGGDGVFISAGTNNAVRANAIYANTGLGIDLHPNGVSANDVGDTDTGPNQGQNFPWLTAATNVPGGLTVAGSLNSRPNTVFTLDCYLNAAGDPSGNGEGQTWVGAARVTTDASGDVVFLVTLPSVLSDRFVTATATDPDGNTSEFSPFLRAATTVPGRTFTVVTTNDSGPGSLRQAILEANLAFNAGDTIAFNIPGAGVHTIAPTNPLPSITDAVMIDGYTQPGAEANTEPAGFSAQLVIRLDGASAGAGADGLKLTGGGSTVRGLAITGFSGNGIAMVTNGNHAIEGNVIGLDTAGAAQGNSANGVFLDQAAGNRVGGTTPAARNVISANGRFGVALEGMGTSANTVEGNFVGTDFTGTAERGNSSGGVFVNGASGNLIGGTSPGAGNRIAFNGGTGVFVNAGAGNAIRANAIYENDGLGIDLFPGRINANDDGDTDSGPNGLQNFPVVTNAVFSATTTLVQGTLNSTANRTFQLDFFSVGRPDSSGHGEGDRWLGTGEVTTDAAGSAAFSLPLAMAASSQIVAATATDPEGNTSEFSAWFNRAASVDLSLGKQGNPSTVLVGEKLTYTLTVTNRGPETALDPEVQDLLGGGATALPSADLEFVSASLSQGTYRVETSPTGPEFRWRPGPIAPGAAATALVHARVFSPGTMTNRATVSSVSPPEVREADNTATAINLVALPVATTGAGAFDPSFGGGDGRADARFEVKPLVDSFYALARLPDGKLLAAGSSADGHSRYSPDLTLARYHASGSRDLAFGDRGQRRFDLGGEYESREQAFAAVLQTDGKILLAGDARVSAVPTNNGDMLVARVTADGALDPTFGRAGFVLLDIGSYPEAARAMAVRNDGAIVVAGHTGSDVVLARLTPGGTLDPAFGIAGQVVTDLGSAEEACAIMLQADGKILVGGTGGSDFLALRYTADGVLDAAFGDRGVARLDLGKTFDQASGSAIDSAGRILLGGARDLDIAVTRLTPAGSLDPAFGTRGVAVSDPGISSAWVRTGLAVLGDDRVTIGGGFEDDLFALRLTNRGTRDTTFGTNGLARVILPERQTANALLALDDGSLILAGESADDSLLVKLTPTGAVDRGFGEDGQLATPFFGHAPVQATAMLLQPDGKTLVAGDTGLAHEHKDIALARFLEDGSLDVAFGERGIVTIDTLGTDHASALALQSGDHKILIAGTRSETRTGDDIFVVRLHGDGSRDAAFGTNGVTVIHRRQDSAAAVVALPDGRILVGGATSDYGRDRGEPFLARLHANGSLDLTFDGDGLLTLPGRSGEIFEIALLGDGRLVLGVRGLPASSLVRLKPDGAFDPTFGAGGLVELPAGNSLNDIVVAADGTITYSQLFDLSEDLTEVEFRRLLPAGDPDASFGLDGVIRDAVPTGAGRLEGGGEFFVDRASRIVTAANPGLNGGVMRLNPDGTRDQTFGVNGFVAGAATIGLTQRPDGRILGAAVGYLERSLMTFRVTQLLAHPESSPHGVFRLASHEVVTREDQGPVRLVVQRIGGAVGRVTVDYVTASDTARSGSDFVPAAGTLTFAEGEAEATVTVPLIVDQNGEARERFRVILSHPTGGAGLDNPRETLVTIPLHAGPSGARDGGYGVNGFAHAEVLPDEPWWVAYVTDLERQPDGKVVVFGTLSPGGDDQQLIARFLPDGTLDPTFSTDGTVQTSISDLSPGVAAGLVLPDGRILAISNPFQAVSLAPLGARGNSALGLTRYQPDGELDRTFGHEGSLTVSLGTGWPRNDHAVDAALLPDGRFLVALWSEMANPDGTSVMDRARVVRFLEDGSLDTSFGHEAIAEVPATRSARAVALGVQADGRIVLAYGLRELANPSHLDCGMARFHADGSLDTTFGANGLVTVVTGARANDEPADLLVQPDGRLLVVGTDPVANRLWAVRLTVAGILDPTFDADGIAFAENLNADANDALLLPSGRIVVLHTYSLSPRLRRLTQFNADGTLDGTFGINGTLTIASGVNAGWSGGALLLEPDNAVLAGFNGRLPGEADEFPMEILLTRIFTEPRPGKIEFGRATFAVDENDRSIAIPAVRTDGAQGDVTLGYTTVPGSARAGEDYSDQAGTLSFLQGETVKLIPVPIHDDRTDEGPETFQVTLHSPIGARLGAVTTATVTISDGPGALEFATPILATFEGLAQIKIPVVRTGGGNGPVAVHYTFHDGTATLGEDYLGVGGELRLGDRSYGEWITAFIHNDGVFEGRETFTVTLSDPQRATLGEQTTAEVTIFEADPDAAATAGSLDRTFGQGGIAATDVFPGPDERAWDLALLGEGRFLAVGETGGDASDFLLVRFTPEGQLDSTWGQGGVVTVDFGGVDSGRAVVLDEDGRVVAAGFTVRDGVSDFAVARLDVTGLLDASFNGDGRATIDFAGADDRALAIALQDDGRLVLAGSSGGGLGRDFAAARLHPDGSFDAGFGRAGRLTLDFSGRHAVAWALALDAQQRILIGGELEHGFVDREKHPLFPDSPAASVDLGVARLTHTGELDSSFARAGWSTTTGPQPQSVNLRQLLVRPDGGVTAAGSSWYDMFKFEMTATGFADERFPASSGVGYAAVNFPRGSGDGFEVGTDAVRGLDGSLFLVGTSQEWASDQGACLAVAKFQPSGSLDPRFGVRGQAVIESAPGAVAGALTTDGRLVTLGGHFALTRLLNTSVGPPEGVLQFTTLGVTVDEGIGAATLTVERPLDSSRGTVTVSYATIGGRAVPGLDFTPASGTLVFEETDTRKSFRVPILNDALSEWQESFQVFLFGPTGGAQLSAFRSATVTIARNDEDGPPGSFGADGTGGASFHDFDFVNEASGRASIYLWRSGDAGRVTLDYATQDGTAKAGEDYTPQLGTATFEPGQTFVAITIPITQDSEIEGEEDFFLELSNPRGGATLEGTFGRRRIVIPDFDPLACDNAGKLDPAFNGNGVVVTSLGQVGMEAAYAVAQDAAGRLVVAGQAGLQGGLGFVRYLPDGSLDTTFAGSGKTVIDVRPGQDSALGLSLRPDGKILALGYSLGAGDHLLSLVRLNEDGSLDTTFGDAGMTRFPLAASVGLQDAQPLADGRFVVVAALRNGTDSDLALLRFKPDGTRDTTFGDGGARTYDFGLRDEFLARLALQSDGKILVAVTTGEPYVSGQDGDRILRFQPNGTLDPAFGTGGIFKTDLAARLFRGGPKPSGSPRFHGLTLDLQGRILAAGEFTVYDRDPTEDPVNAVLRSGAVLLRLNPDGTFDSTLSDGGLALFEGGLPSRGYRLDLADSALAVQSDGRMLVHSHGHAIRLLADGRPDIGFGQKGVADLPLAAGGGWGFANHLRTCLLVQADGHVVALGFDTETNSDFQVARLIGGPAPGAFRLMNQDYRVAENAGSLTVRVERVCGFDGPASVTVQTADDTALAGRDYRPTTQVLTWEPFEAGAKTVAIPITDDGIAQGDLTFRVALTNPTGGASLSEVNSAEVTILDDESAGEFNFRVVQSTAAENASTATIVVDRLKGHGGAVSVDFRAGGGSAVVGADYTAVAGTLHFADRETSGSFQITLRDDGELDGEKTVNLVLETPSPGTALGHAASARLTIVDDERPSGGVFDFAAADYATREDSGGVLVTITRTGGDGAARVRFTTASGGAAELDDYGPVSDELSFEAGTTSQEIFIPIFEDTVAEGEETILLTLSDPVGDQVRTVRTTPTVGLGTATVRISDNDAPTLLREGGFLEFAATSFVGSESIGRAQLYITRLGGAEGAAAVEVRFASDTARAGEDFIAAPVLASFADGKELAVVPVPLVRDLLRECAETFTAVLANPSGTAWLGQRTNATVTIADTEPPSIACPANLTVLVRPGVGSAAVNYTVTASDNCAVTSIQCTPPAGATFPVGVTAVRCVASDAAGQTNACSFTVTVVESGGGPPPRLEISQAGNTVSIAWPNTATGYVLETTFHLTSPIPWQPIADGVTDDGHWRTYRVTDATEVSRFFRLRLVSGTDYTRPSPALRAPSPPRRGRGPG